MTQKSIINAGYYLDGGRQAVRQLLNKCVTCRRQRAPPEEQFMADLPPDRVIPVPPFLHRGLDVMDSWRIHHGITTRKGSSEKKMWAVFFTCLASRAIHVELILRTEALYFNQRRMLTNKKWQGHQLHKCYRSVGYKKIEGIFWSGRLLVDLQLCCCKSQWRLLGTQDRPAETHIGEYFERKRQASSFVRRVPNFHAL